MGSIVSPFQFAHVAEGLIATPTYNDAGIQMTAGANDTMGAAVEIVSAQDHDGHLIEFAVQVTNASAQMAESLVDILIDPAGGSAWTTLISGILVAPTSFPMVPTAYRFPVRVPKGASLGARAQTANGSTRTVRISIRVFGEPSRPDALWYGQGVETLGDNTADSGGTPVTPAVSPTWGAWTNIGDPTLYRYGALQVGHGGQGDAVFGNEAYHVEVGAGGSAFAIGTLNIYNSAVETTYPPFLPVMPNVDIPAGMQLQARIHGTDVAPQDITLYGVY